MTETGQALTRGLADSWLGLKGTHATTLRRDGVLLCEGLDRRGGWDGGRGEGEWRNAWLGVVVAAMRFMLGMMVCTL